MVNYGTAKVAELLAYVFCITFACMDIIIIGTSIYDGIYNKKQVAGIVLFTFTIIVMFLYLRSFSKAIKTKYGIDK